MYRLILSKNQAYLAHPSILAVGLLGVFFNLLPLPNFFMLIILSQILYRCPSKLSNSPLKWAGIVLVSFVIAIYRPENFSYPIVWESALLNRNKETFELTINVAKTLAGYLTLIALIFHFQLKTSTYTSVCRSSLISFSGVVLVITVGALLTDNAYFPKWQNGLLTFFAVNAFTTVLAEEVFFRKVIQQPIACLFSNGRSLAAILVPVLLSALLFSLAHGIASLETFITLFVAGCVYGAVFHVTGRLLAAIFCHWAVNALHIVLFDYPL